MATAKVPSTPADSSIGVLNGIARACERAEIDPKNITHVMHGTTVATNAMLTGSGARVGLVTTDGYRQVLQIARSFVPGGLGGWVIYEPSAPLAPLELTVEVHERVAADGAVVRPLDEAQTRESLAKLSASGIEALTVSLINSFENPVHERRVRELAEEVLPGIPVSLSSDVIPEMQEYERTVTTVANSYVRPAVENYVRNLESELSSRLDGVTLRILRSDGGLAAAKVAQEFPVNLLMSGPAGGVSGAIWVAEQAGFENLLTFDMGGTSTDVALVREGRAALRRETTVGDVTVRASSVDVRTVGAGGGSIAHVPELTGALRVGPQSAGADPGPAAYGRGGSEPTVTDANVVLGYFPDTQRLGGDMALDRDAAIAAVQQIADARGLSLERAAAGIVDIVNENMCGALRLVSVEQGYDPREFALIAFGGAGPLHANALAKLIHAWPVIIPPGPGVLCAYGDATTRLRNEASRSFVRRFSATDTKELAALLDELGAQARASLEAEGEGVEATRYEADLRYQGQGLQLAVSIDLEELKRDGLDHAGAQFDEMHTQLFTFALEAEKEFVNLRAAAESRGSSLTAVTAPAGRGAESARIGEQSVYVEGERATAGVYDRAQLGAGDVIDGPAIVTEMDSTTLVLPGHRAQVDALGNLLIRPESE
jgi:N-methylhydantoinase A